VWFVKPFEHPTQGWVTAESIRRGLGNFDKVIRCPARFGARMSQAFSATDQSITVTAEEIHPVDDIRNDARVNFTDGVGTISRQVADDITAALEKGRRGRRKRYVGLSHSAFQVRLGGIKGMLSVDYTMSSHDSTICVRPSMIKFDAPNSLDIEIAGTFENPKPMYLNRPLIMILEVRSMSIAKNCN
jgi:RNA-dependent RNA polymerase